jgi:hypothetical protein
MDMHFLLWGRGSVTFIFYFIISISLDGSFIFQYAFKAAVGSIYC